MKAAPDQNHMFNVDDLPPETYEPPATPNGRMRDMVNYLTIDMQYAIKNKLVKKLRDLIPKALQMAPDELELLICHGELVLQQELEKE
jgi:hypothetical protein